MTKPILVAVHGMGSQTKESFKEEVSGILTAALRLYPGHEQQTIENFIQIEVIAYNDIFESWRQKIAEDASETLDHLKLSPGKLDLINEGLKQHAKISEKDNLYTHWLDVVFYMTLIGEYVRISVAEQFTSIYEDALKVGNRPQISVLANSLGTAVAHDSLSKLYEGDSTDSPLKEEWKKLKIESGEFPIHTIFQIANVSALLKTFKSPYRSIVRPGENGCCRYMFSFDHGIDPIPNVVSFDPDNNEGWLTNDEWSKGIFHHERIHEITQVDVHGLNHYIANPAVHIRLFDSLFPQNFDVSEADRQKIKTKYLDGTLHKNVKALRKALKGISVSNPNSINDIINAFKKAAKIIKTYEDLV